MLSIYDRPKMSVLLPYVTSLIRCSGRYLFLSEGFIDVDGYFVRSGLSTWLSAFVIVKRVLYIPGFKCYKASLFVRDRVDYVQCSRCEFSIKDVKVVNSDVDFVNSLSAIVDDKYAFTVCSYWFVVACENDGGIRNNSDFFVLNVDGFRCNGVCTQLEFFASCLFRTCSGSDKDDNQYGCYYSHGGLKVNGE